MSQPLAPGQSRAVSNRLTIGRALGRLARRLAQARFRLFHARRYGQRHRARVAGLQLVVEAEVFPPELFGSSALLAKYLARAPLSGDERALDLGTGSGVCALVLARRGLSVVATDVSPRALVCAGENASRLGLETRIELRLGSLFAPVEGERFDLVCCNPPFYRGNPSDLLDAAWRSPDFLDGLATGLRDHLSANGRGLLVLSSDIGLPAYQRQLEREHLRVSQVATAGLVGERMVVWQVSSG